MIKNEIKTKIKNIMKNEKKRWLMHQFFFLIWQEINLENSPQKKNKKKSFTWYYYTNILCEKQL